MSLEQAIDLMWPDKSPEERDTLINTIKTEMIERSTRASNALGSFDTPPKGSGVKTESTGRDVDDDNLKDLDKYKK